jgi:hypothetical protein
MPDTRNIVTFCVFCGNPADEYGCGRCHEYKGVVEGRECPECQVPVEATELHCPGCGMEFQKTMEMLVHDLDRWHRFLSFARGSKPQVLTWTYPEFVGECRHIENWPVGLGIWAVRRGIVVKDKFIEDGYILKTRKRLRDEDEDGKNKAVPRRGDPWFDTSRAL